MSQMRVTDDPRDEIVADGLETIEDARAFLSVSRTTLYQLMDTGKIAFVRFGRNRRIPRRALMDFAKEQLVVA
jgi:excisionase family DNA binding protein